MASWPILNMSFTYKNLNNSNFSNDLLLECFELERRFFNDYWQKNSWEGLFSGTRNYNLFLALNYCQEVVFFILYEDCIDFIHLQKILTHPNFRGNSNSLGLFNKAFENTTKKIILEVRKSNQRAISFYQKCGFGMINENKNFYSDGESALVFVKQDMGRD